MDQDNMYMGQILQDRENGYVLIFLFKVGPSSDQAW